MLLFEINIIKAILTTVWLTVCFALCTVILINGTTGTFCILIFTLSGYTVIVRFLFGTDPETLTATRGKNVTTTANTTIMPTVPLRCAITVPSVPGDGTCPHRVNDGVAIGEPLSCAHLKAITLITKNMKCNRPEPPHSLVCELSIVRVR